MSVRRQGQGHKPLKVGNSAIFKGDLLLHLYRGLANTTDSQIRGQYLQVIGAGFFIFVLVFVSHDFEVGSK